MPRETSASYHISPHTLVQPTPCMGFVNTPDNLRHVRPQHNITRSPHTPVQPTPRMGPISTPDNLRHARPQHHITYLPIRRYNQRHVWGLSTRRITYATCDLNIISQDLPIRRYYQRHVWGLSQLRITYATKDLNIISQYLPIRQY
ncbi:hypothetical protein L3X38_008698 [Prunus dulcis]|uniref:Uncharacterized protein n=1 Tax=Prunus dulcis TaxID=3755 RepID=A0AAD5F7D4_PRUDU|nr:hypothetical protein L3X38_008698 [Prunus dulcis]